MASNEPTGDGHRIGAVKSAPRSRLKLKGRSKRSKESGQFMDQKADEEKFKGVRREK